MGELILCNQALAVLPYYLEGASLNIYSLEELSYYIENNLYLLGTEFMSEELCNWLEKELGRKETAEKLHEISLRNGALAEFVQCILAESGYCSKEKQKQIADTLQEMGQRSEYECGKLRADRYMENHKYVNAIYEYRKLLMMEEKNTVLTGDVWHNLGCAYARLFLFQEAAVCYKKAYELNENPESMRECLFACRCLSDKTEFQRRAAEYGLSESEISEISSRIHEASGMEEIREFEQQMNVLFENNRQQDIDAQIEEWKDIYRKNCKI